MSSLSIVRRQLLRLLTLALLLVVLVGTPMVVFRVVGVSRPGATWRAVWQHQHLSSAVAVQFGLACFLVLWAWFAVTALWELRRIWPHRHERGQIGRVRLQDGPAGWVRGAVRFVALSSVSAAVLAGGLGAGVRATGPEPLSHVVVTGDTYWSIADAQLDVALGRDARPDEVSAHTKELVRWNSARLGHRDPTLLIPGETVTLADPAAAVVRQESSPPTPSEAAPESTVPQETVPAPVVPAPIAPASMIQPSSGRPPTPVPAGAIAPAGGAAPVGAAAPVEERAPTIAPEVSPVRGVADSSVPGLIGAGMLAAGALAVVRSRRGRVLRSSPSGSRLNAPTFREARLELQLRAIEPGERLARLEVALRAAAPALASQGAAVLAVTMDAHGEVRLFLSESALPIDELWRADLMHGTWRLPAGVPLDDVASAAAASASFPCPALVQLGVRAGHVDDGAEVYVDLEAMGVLSIDSPSADDIAGMLATTAAWSPWMEGGEVLATADVAPDCGEIRRAADHDEVWGCVADRQARVIASGAGVTLSARVVDGVDAWAPLVVVSRGSLPPGQSVRASAGVGVVVLGASSSPFTLRAEGDRHVLEPFGIGLVPSVADRSSLATAAELVAHAASLPLAVVPDSLPLRSGDVECQTGDTSHPLAAIEATWREPRWDVLVTLLGQVTVQDRAGRAAEFEKAKSMELLVWLTRHRERPTRGAARAALWDLAVRDSTFANVVSDCRRSLARLVAPPQGEEWVARTLSDDLPLHARVLTDAELLADRVEAARGLAAEDAIAILRPGVELLHGMPFSGPGAGYLWVDGEGHTSALVLLATGAAEQLAQHHLSLGDIDGVFWATGRGLLVLPGHEELIALRMRAHALRGDTAGVRLEWEQYERALAADSWSGDEPSPKLAALRRELLSVPGRR
ncbi:MAG: hypothetical protein ACOYMR_10090 [Ilumatobacteraceae bacterium]